MQQYNLLCEDKWKVGLIGSLMYSGTLLTVLWVPAVADRYGRKWVVVVSYLLFVAAVGVIGCSSNLNALYAALFVVGMTFPGRIIVGLNFLIEYFPQRAKNTVTNVKMFSIGAFLFIIDATFQFGTRNYKEILWTLTAGTLLSTLYVLFFIPESPSFLHERGTGTDYDEARSTLTYIANFNGVRNVKGRPYGRFKFVTEMEKLG